MAAGTAPSHWRTRPAHGKGDVVRTLRLSLFVMLTLALLGGPSEAVLAQDEEEAGPVTYVTGTVLSQDIDTTEEEWSQEGGVGHARGFKVLETWEWSDPRLPTEKATVMNFEMYDIGDFRELAFQSTHLLEDPDGHWAGTASGFFDQDGGHHGVEFLTGHGAYEGLFATIGFTADGAEGLIFEGEMPPMPDPLEPPAE